MKKKSTVIPWGHLVMTLVFVVVLAINTYYWVTTYNMGLYTAFGALTLTEMVCGFMIWDSYRGYSLALIRRKNKRAKVVRTYQHTEYEANTRVRRAR